MTVVPYVTDPSAIDCPPWVPLGERWITLEPLRDNATGGYAHLTYAGALDAAAALGARLPSVDDIMRLHAVGHELRPVTLPSIAMLHEAGIPMSAIDAYRNANMCGIDWCRIHDDAARAQLASWDGRKPLANAGKHWVCGAPPGRAYLMGWWMGGRWIQPPPAPGSQGPHDRGHTDYSMCTILVRDSAP